MSISDRLDEIEARADAATDGPWEERIDSLMDEVDVYHDHEQVSWVAGLGDMSAPRVLADAEFIAHARTDVPRLVAALRAVLGVCNESTIEARPHGGGKPYMIVPIREVRAAIEAALGGES